MAPAGTGPSRAELLASGNALVEKGDLTGAITALTEANRISRRPGLERRLVALRHEAGHEITASAEPTGPSVAGADPFPSVSGELPEVTGAKLTTALARDTIAHHGAILVRKLLDHDTAATLRDDIDRAFDAFDARDGGAPIGQTAPWFVPFRPLEAYEFGHRRGWVRMGGAIWAADSPRSLWDLIDGLERAGLRPTLTELLGGRPVISVNKCALRRVTAAAQPTWHQDGSFLGEGVRTLNVWIALSDCGGDEPSPGLDVVPARIDRILPVGTPGARIRNAIAPDEVDRARGSTPVARPRLRAGDGLLFDELFLHRTGADAGMTHDRYAVECWFFAPSTAPPDYVPLLF